MPDAIEFFEKKKPWSKYKDLILDYYLKPYLAKVARIGKPLAIVDCFAGPGIFGDGDRGSPLIIAEHLSRMQDGGVSVRGMFIESVPVLFDQLERNLSNTGFPVDIRQGDFHQFVGEIAELAGTHTVFLYLDPLLPSQLKFGDLRSTYDRLREGQSVETLVNFLSTGFVRRAEGLAPRAFLGDNLDPQHREVIACNQIAGGEYWQQIVFDKDLSQGDRIDRVVRGYADHLHEWFKYVLKYPIREQYSDEQPKYHLVFGSRYPDAIDLMNRAMVKARRDFVGAFSVDGMLFENQPKEEVVEAQEIEALIVATSQRVGRTTWKLLRVQATVFKPCFYNDSEFNKAIKAAISNGTLCSTASGIKIENSADVWAAL